FVGHRDEIGVADCVVGSAPEPASRESIKDSAKKFAARTTWPTPARGFFEAFVQTVQADRAGHEQAVEVQLLFGRGKRTDESINDIKALSVFLDERFCARREPKLPNGKAGGGIFRGRESIGEAVMLHDMAGCAPFVCQVH